MSVRLSTGKICTDELTKGVIEGRALFSPSQARALCDQLLSPDIFCRASEMSSDLVLRLDSRRYSREFSMARSALQ